MKGSGGRRRHLGSAERPEHPCAGSESPRGDGAGAELPAGAGAGAGGAGAGELSGLELVFIHDRERSREQESERDTTGRHLQRSCHPLPLIPEFLAGFAAGDKSVQSCSSSAGAAHHPSGTFPVEPIAAFLLSPHGVSVFPAGAVPWLPFSLLRLQQVRKSK